MYKQQQVKREKQKARPGKKRYSDAAIVKARPDATVHYTPIIIHLSKTM
jgi:hypothetical protein